MTVTEQQHWVKQQQRFMEDDHLMGKWKDRNSGAILKWGTTKSLYVLSNAMQALLWMSLSI